ncbi:hypothetical protein A0H81_11179 [Grifola frondosa]|uniref:Uncharacterized protein n=1 Tax=Grifola frondosa TaxID=5627 RepID=A0A1C7LW06_GRIFR|nr:hypothetical protein A0H81_11179 [Grifola frondosa]
MCMISRQKHTIGDQPALYQTSHEARFTAFRNAAHKLVTPHFAMATSKDSSCQAQEWRADALVQNFVVCCARLPGDCFHDGTALIRDLISSHDELQDIGLNAAAIASNSATCGQLLACYCTFYINALTLQNFRSNRPIQEIENIARLPKFVYPLPPNRPTSTQWALNDGSTNWDEHRGCLCRPTQHLGVFFNDLSRSDPDVKSLIMATRFPPHIQAPAFIGSNRSPPIYLLILPAHTVDKLHPRLLIAIDFAHHSPLLWGRSSSFSNARGIIKYERFRPCEDWSSGLGDPTRLGARRRFENLS